MSFAYLLEVPGAVADASTDRGALVRCLDELIGFRPGVAMNADGYLSRFMSFPGGFETDRGLHVHTGVGSFNEWIIFQRLVTLETLERCQELLDDADVRYERDGDFYRLCCSAATAWSSSLLFFNIDYEPILLTASPLRLFHVEATAYLRSMTEQDEMLEKSVVEAWIEANKEILAGIAGGEPTEFKLFYAGQDVGGRSVRRRYADGSVVTYPRKDPWEQLPFDLFMDPRKGLMNETQYVCDHCIQGMELRFKREFFRSKDVLDAWGRRPYWADLLIGQRAAQQGYEFDPGQVSFRFGKKKLLREYSHKRAA